MARPTLAEILFGEVVECGEDRSEDGVECFVVVGIGDGAADGAEGGGRR